MDREDRLVQTFVTLADTLVDRYDIIDFLQVLAERCVELLDVAAAGIMLADGHGTLRHAACSNEEMRLVELFELQLKEGPCFDAYERRAVVRCDTPAEVAQRWPRFAPNASQHGFQAVSAVPMRLRRETIGALNLFSAMPVALDNADIAVAQAMADVATIGILSERAIHDARTFSSQLEVALESRVVIEQAKGVLAERAHITVDEAFARIREYARAHNRLLSETARALVDGSLSADEMVITARTPPTGGASPNAIA